MPLLGGCDRFTDRVPSIAVLLRESQFDKQNVIVTGRVTRLIQRRSEYTGKPWESFLVCSNGACVRVYMREHSPIHNNDRVRVTGEFYRAFRSGDAVYRNEIEATHVVSLQ